MNIRGWRYIMMARRFLPLFAVLALILLVTAGFAGSFALNRTANGAVAGQPATPSPTATSTTAAMYPLPPELAFLQGLTPTERFDHYLGGQVGFVNPSGQNVYVNWIPGKVSSISANSIAITPNGATQTRTFNITSTTRVVARPQTGTLSAFSQGDRVVVYVINNGTNAVAITEPHMMMGMEGHGMHRGAGPGMMPGAAKPAAGATATPTTAATAAPAATATP